LFLFSVWDWIYTLYCLFWVVVFILWSFVQQFNVTNHNANQTFLFNHFRCSHFPNSRFNAEASGSQHAAVRWI